MDEGQMVAWTIALLALAVGALLAWALGMTGEEEAMRLLKRHSSHPHLPRGPWSRRSR